VVTRDEYATLYGTVPGTDAREQQFRVLDRNNNGEISRGEWRGETVLRSRGPP
jgi:hypothetical protein